MAATFCSCSLILALLDRISSGLNSSSWVFTGSLSLVVCICIYVEIIIV